MRPTAFKLCLVGEPGVGKTSLAQRLLHDRYPPAPTALGITVEAHVLASPAGDPLPVTVWDVAGSSALDTLNQAYLSGVDGVAAVADASTPISVGRALALIAQVRALYPHVAAALLLNKRDLASARVVPGSLPSDLPVFEVSARDGIGVVTAFARLAGAAMQGRPASG